MQVGQQQPSIYRPTKLVTPWGANSHLPPSLECVHNLVVPSTRGYPDTPCFVVCQFMRPRQKRSATAEGAWAASRRFARPKRQDSPAAIVANFVVSEIGCRDGPLRLVPYTQRMPMAGRVCHLRNKAQFGYFFGPIHSGSEWRSRMGRQGVGSGKFPLSHSRFGGHFCGKQKV